MLLTLDIPPSPCLGRRIARFYSNNVKFKTYHSAGGQRKSRSTIALNILSTLIPVIKFKAG